MTAKEAREMLKNTKPSALPFKVNPSLTHAEAIGIVERGISNYKDGDVLSDILEKRIYQVHKNQRRPRY